MGHWGSVGISHNWGRIRCRPGDADAQGLIRVVEPGIDYELADYSGRGDAPIPLWHAGGGNRFELDLGANQAPAFYHLAGLADRLHRRHAGAKQLPEGDADLALLDEVVDQLLAAAAWLHERNRGVRLLQPLNVMWYALPEGEATRSAAATENGRERPPIRLLLPDVGFVRKEGFGLPRWLWGRESDAVPPGPNSPDPAQRPDWPERPFLGLWDAEPQSINEKEFTGRNLGGRRGDVRDVQSDLTTLGRLMVWILTGEVRSKAPPARADDERSKVGAWQVIEDALAGRLGSAEELRRRLRACPLSDYFRGRQVETRKRRGIPRRAVIFTVAAAVLLAAAGGFGWWLVHHSWIIPPQFPPSPLCPEVPAVSALRPLLDEWEQAQGPAAQLAVLQRMYAIELQKTPEVSAVERKCREKFRQEFIKDLEVRGTGLPREWQKHPPAPSEYSLAHAQIVELENQYQTIQGFQEPPNTPVEDPTWLKTLRLYKRVY